MSLRHRYSLDAIDTSAKKSSGLSQVAVVDAVVVVIKGVCPRLGDEVFRLSQ